MLKRFLEWIKLKSTLHHGEAFTRPVIVLKKYDRYSFLAAPLTTQGKEGTWYHTFTHNQKKQTAVLSQTRVVNYKRLKELVGKTDSTDYNNIKRAFLDLHK
jgi:hypothetical protein